MSIAFRASIQQIWRPDLARQCPSINDFATTALIRHLKWEGWSNESIEMVQHSVENPTHLEDVTISIKSAVEQVDRHDKSVVQWLHSRHKTIERGVITDWPRVDTLHAILCCDECGPALVAFCEPRGICVMSANEKHEAGGYSHHHHRDANGAKNSSLVVGLVATTAWGRALLGGLWIYNAEGRQSPGKQQRDTWIMLDSLHRLNSCGNVIPSTIRRGIRGTKTCCDACGHVVPLRGLVCDRCTLVTYCSVVCQRAHWAWFHRLECADTCKRLA